MIFLNCFLPTFIMLAAMTIFIVLKALAIYFFDLGLHMPQKSWLDSLYLSVISFLTASYGDKFPAERRGKITLMITGTFGVVLMGLFISASYSSFQDFHTYQARKSHDEKVLRVLSEIRQDYINVMSNNSMSDFVINKKWSPSNLKEIQDKIYDNFTREYIPDLNGQYHQKGKDAFLSNSEIINKKITDLLLINFDTNYASDLKYIAFLSRNLVNDFHWNFFKSIALERQNRDFVNSVLIAGTDEQSSIVGKFLNIESETDLLIKKIYNDL